VKLNSHNILMREFRKAQTRLRRGEDRKEVMGAG
jgi:hypothetical protein